MYITENKLRYDYKIVKYTTRYREDVISLLSYMWKRPMSQRDDIFKWKYENNPLTDIPYAYVALYDNRVAGFRGFFPTRFKINDELVSMLSPADTIVDPNHRRRGLFTTMTKFAMREITEEGKIKFFLNLSSNQYSIPGYLKMGWTAVSPEYPLISKTFTGLFHGKISGRKFYKNNKIIFDVLDEIIYNMLGSESGDENGKLEVSLRIDAKDMAELCELRERKRLTHIKDRRYLEWRFKRPWTPYIMCYLWNSVGELEAYTVLLYKREGYYQLVDYEYREPQHIQKLLSTLFKRFKINFVTTWGFAKEKETINSLKKSGFYLPRFIYKLNPRYEPLPFLVRPVGILENKNAWNVLGYDVRDVNSWNLNPIDSDGT